MTVYKKERFVSALIFLASAAGWGSVLAILISPTGPTPTLKELLSVYLIFIALSYWSMRAFIDVIYPRSLEIDATGFRIRGKFRHTRFICWDDVVGIDLIGKTGFEKVAVSVDKASVTLIERLLAWPNKPCVTLYGYYVSDGELIAELNSARDQWKSRYGST
ncbi:MAG: hypothetical protein AAGG69_01190 [Pseudomonadota bacterium]